MLFLKNQMRQQHKQSANTNANDVQNYVFKELIMRQQTQIKRQHKCTYKVENTVVVHTRRNYYFF